MKKERCDSGSTQRYQAPRQVRGRLSRARPALVRPRPEGARTGGSQGAPAVRVPAAIPTALCSGSRTGLNPADGRRRLLMADEVPWVSQLLGVQDTGNVRETLAFLGVRRVYAGMGPAEKPGGRGCGRRRPRRPSQVGPAVRTAAGLLRVFTLGSGVTEEREGSAVVLGTVAWSAESLRAGAAALPHHPGPQAVCPCRERDTSSGQGLAPGEGRGGRTGRKMGDVSRPTARPALQTLGDVGPGRKLDKEDHPALGLGHGASRVPDSGPLSPQRPTYVCQEQGLRGESDPTR